MSLRAVVADLERAAELAGALARDAADLHEVAYGAASGNGERRATPTGYAHTTTGDARAKRTYEALVDVAADAVAELERLHVASERIFGAGSAGGRPGVPISDAELAAALEAQRRRRERGEWTPARRVRQPGPVRR